MKLIENFLKVSLLGLTFAFGGQGVLAQNVPQQTADTEAPTEVVASQGEAALTLSLADARARAQSALSDGLSDYFAQWEQAANRAEEVLDRGLASNGALEALRQELVGYRQQFLTNRDANGTRIASIKAQLDSLGTVPEDGEAESIALLRGELNRQLVLLTAPQQLADLAYSRVQGLIGEIDTLIRARQTRTLLERAPMPLNPENWPTAVSDVQDVLLAFWNETARSLSSASSREATRARLPMIALLLGGALLLLGRGRNWAHRAGSYLRGFGGRGTGVWRFVVSLLQVLLPFLGTVLLVRAIDFVGILGVRGTLLLEDVPLWSFIFFASHWLADRLYVYEIKNDLIPFDPGTPRRLHVLLLAMASVMVVQLMLVRVDAIEQLEPVSFAVLNLPLVLLTSLLLLRLHRLLARQRAADAKADEQGASVESALGNSAGHLLGLLRRLIMVLAIAAPVLAALGYVNASTAVSYPTMMTFALAAFGMVVKRFIVDLYGWLSGRGSEESVDTLFAAMTGFALAIASLPVFALIWGARLSDLTELWSQFLEGFSIGETQISPTIFLTFVAVFAVGYAATRVFQGSLRSTLLPKTRLDAGGQNAVVSGVGYVGIFLSALVAVSTAGLDLSSLAIVAGALSVGIGFGLQTIVSNFVSGIILLIERPVSKGDWIEVGGLMGYVRDISVRSTRIETFDRTDVIVPNSDLISGTVTNYTRGNTVGRVIAPVGVAYGTDPRRVEEILMQIVKGHEMIMHYPGPWVVFKGFGADSLDFEIRGLLRDVNNKLTVHSDLNYAIAKRFEEEGIEIPFAQRDIWIRNPEALSSGSNTPVEASVDGDTLTGIDPASEPEITESDLSPKTVEASGGES